MTMIGKKMKKSIGLKFCKGEGEGLKERCLNMQRVNTD